MRVVDNSIWEEFKYRTSLNEITLLMTVVDMAVVYKQEESICQ